MKVLAIASGLCILLSGCIGFHWTSKVDDGAVYELNREMYVVEDDGLLLVDARTEHPEYYTIKGTLPAGTKLQEAAKTAHQGFSFWWYFGPYSHVDVYGEVLGGDFKGRLVDFGEHRQCWTLESIVSAVPSTDIGTCVRLIALSGISSALRPKNMIKSTF